MARRQSCSDLPPTSIIIPPYSRSSSPPFVTKASSHSKSTSTDMRSSVKSRLLRNWMGQSGQQQYKVLERSLSRFHQKDRYRIDVLKTNLLPWLHKDQPNLDSLSEASLKTGRQLIMQWWSALLLALPDALYTDRCHYFDCIIALMTRKEFEEFDRVEDMMSKPTTPSTMRTFIEGSGTGSVTEHTSSTTSVSSSTTLGSGYPFTDSSAFWSLFQQYRKLLTQSLHYAIERLNQKGVYSNVITFCAKILAICFFKLPGVAFGLLHALPASRSYIGRMVKAMDLQGENCGMPQIMTFFPEHLSPICFTGTGSWWREFEKQKRKMNSGEASLPMEMFGNWVRRWQSDDSELFFAFYRHYHHCLSQYLEVPLQRIQAGGWATTAVTPKVYAGAPGYLYLSAFFLTKIEGLVHREIHPVTTIVQFEPNAANGSGTGAAERDRAMASVATGEFPGTAAPPDVKLPNGVDAGKDNANGGPTNGKPKVLDMASRRFVETIVAIMEDHGTIYGAMLDIWIKAVVTRTSVYEVESVFCLLDFLDMLIAELESRECIRLYDSELSTVPLNRGPAVMFVPIHVQFILSTLHLLLTGSDHTITLMRTISFIYQNFSLLTSTVQTLEQLTLGILLSPDIFERCFLHWARNVRLYYMRCLVWRVARIGGGVGILPGWRPWTPEEPSVTQDQHEATGGMASNGAPSSGSSTRKTTKEALEALKGLPIEHSLSLIVRNILEVMESRIDMVKRQYAGELTEGMSTKISDKDSEVSPPDSIPSSPGLERTPSGSTVGESLTPPSSRQRFLSNGTAQDEESQEKTRAFYQLQAHQIYLSHQKLAQSDGSGKTKDRTKKLNSRSSLIGRKFRRISKTEASSPRPGNDMQRRGSLNGDSMPCNTSTGTLVGGGSLVSKRASTGSASLTAGSLFRWMFLGGQNGSSNSNTKMLCGSGGSSVNLYAGQEMGKDEDRQPNSHHSLASFSSSSSSTSLTMLTSGNDQSSDIYRHNGAGRSYCNQQLSSSLRYGLSRKYPEHLTTYAGRSILEHTTVLNEYVDWLAQCHAYGIKSRMVNNPNGGGAGAGAAAAAAGQGQPGGVPGIGLGPGGSGNADEQTFSGFSVFSLSMGGVVDANVVAEHQDEWIYPGMAQMMMLRFPGLVVEWPKFWNNSREAWGPPPGPITTLPALAVVNNPAFSLGKGNAGGVSSGVSAGAGGPFGGASLNGASMNGPSSLRHQQQAQMHHQQQMQLWSRNAAVVAATTTAAATGTAFGAVDVGQAVQSQPGMSTAGVATSGPASGASSSY
ncbi:hypothetical protein BGZ54_000130 [Gamsiella multidivaricata]|nr:hypothetical protein BGZ54_000130 [Gamsiella multidivaricata]